MTRAIIGIDIGSRYTKLCIMESGVFRFIKLETYSFYKEYTDKKGFAAKNLCQEHDILTSDTFFGFTGYGKHRIEKILNGRCNLFNELKMHMNGAIFQTGLKNFILLDIGGQDSKVIVVEDGRMVDFETNDRCASGTGRFIENASRVMGMEMTEFINCSDSPVEITSKCAVFAETEIIELLAENCLPKNIAAGINLSVVKKVLPLIERFNYNDNLIFTGGTALNCAVVQYLAKMLSKRKIKVIVPEQPLFNGAIGVVRTLVEMEENNGYCTF